MLTDPAYITLGVRHDTSDSCQLPEAHCDAIILPLSLVVDPGSNTTQTEYNPPDRLRQKLTEASETRPGVGNGTQAPPSYPVVGFAQHPSAIRGR